MKKSLKNQSELIVHRIDGRIREKNSYGNDLYPPEGWFDIIKTT